MGTSTPASLGAHESDDGRAAGLRGWLTSVDNYRKLAWAVTIGTALVTVAGGVVRLTGSGLGCADWPRCSETRLIDVSSGHTAIEQINRLLSIVLGVPTVLFVVTAFMIGRRRLRMPAVGVLVMIFANAVLGGLAVLGDHPALVQSHFLLAMLTVVFGMIGVARSTPSWWHADRVLSGPARLVVAIVGIGTAAALVTGTVVTGTGPHAGDEEARRYGFELSSVARIHSLSVIVTLVAALYFAWRAMTADGGIPADLRSVFSTWLFVALLQGALGYTQYFTDVPAALAAVHIAGSAALWVVTMAFVLQSGTAVSVGDGRAA